MNDDKDVQIEMLVGHVNLTEQKLAMALAALRELDSLAASCESDEHGEDYDMMDQDDLLYLAGNLRGLCSQASAKADDIEKML